MLCTLEFLGHLCLKKKKEGGVVKELYDKQKGDIITALCSYKVLTS